MPFSISRRFSRRIHSNLKSSLSVKGFIRWTKDLESQPRCERLNDLYGKRTAQWRSRQGGSSREWRWSLPPSFPSSFFGGERPFDRARLPMRAGTRTLFSFFREFD